MGRGCLSVSALGREWWSRIIDVCGLGEFRRRSQRDVFITHLHLDHLPLKEYIRGARLRLYTSSFYFKALEEMYGDSFEVCEYGDVIEVDHTSMHGARAAKVKAFGFFFKNELVLPECDNPSKLIDEYKPRFAVIFASYQSHSHPADFNNYRRDVFILDNRVWKPYAPNIIPKIVFSRSPQDVDLYRRFYGRRII